MQPQTHSSRFHLRRLPGHFAVEKLDPTASSPRLPTGPCAALLRREGELTRVRSETVAPGDDPVLESTGGWVAFEVEGPFDFEAVGVLAELSRVLAAASIPLLALSTFETDLVLVAGARAEAAAEAWVAAGHRVAASTSPTD